MSDSPSEEELILELNKLSPKVKQLIKSVFKSSFKREEDLANRLNEAKILFRQIPYNSPIPDDLLRKILNFIEDKGNDGFTTRFEDEN